MATKKRRMGRGMRGLGMTPEAHGKRAMHWAPKALDSFKAATASSRRNQCASAFRNYVEGDRYYTLAAQDDSDSQLPHRRYEEMKIWAPLSDARTAAEEAFKMKCLVGGGLSGLGRKPTRRKSRR